MFGVNQFAAFVYLGLVVVLSLLSFAFYGFDKRRATQGGRRVPERTLHLLAFLGGWPGALLGQRQFRHKTKKVSFQITFWLLVVAHLALLGGVIYAAGKYSKPTVPTAEVTPQIKITPRGK